VFYAWRRNDFEGTKPLVATNMGRKKATPKAPLEEVKLEPEQDEKLLKENIPTSNSSTVAATPQTPREPVKANKYNLTELKNACDDCLKKYLSRPDSFQEQHTHTDVRLVLGYASVIIGGASVFYAWRRNDFEGTKPLVAVGVALYFILTSLQTLYIWYVEKETIFVGKRKTLDKRILTERLTISSKSTKSTPKTPPMYSLEITYLHSANSGKTTLKKGRETGQKEYNALFDSEGYLVMEVLEEWVDGLVAKAISS